jgi:hypothetical protein
MPLLRVEAEKLSNNTLLSGVVEEIIDRDAMFALLPFMRVNSKALVYNRENALAEGDFLDPNEAINEGAATFTEVTAKLRILAGDVDVDKFLQTTMSDTSDQVAIQLMQKAKALSRQFQRTVAQGNATTSPKEFDGLPQLVANDMTITAGANGAAVTLEMLDELKDMVKYGIDAYVMRAGTWRAIRTALRAMGGTTPVSIEMENFGYPLPALDGIPVVINDWLEADEVQGTENASCSIYGVRMNEVDGLHGIYGGDSAGLVAESVGTVQNKDAWRFRLKWYAGMALRSTRSLARLKGVTNI